MDRKQFAAMIAAIILAIALHDLEKAAALATLLSMAVVITDRR